LGVVVRTLKAALKPALPCIPNAAAMSVVREEQTTKGQIDLRKYCFAQLEFMRQAHGNFAESWGGEGDGKAEAAVDH
jgi:hypothetical protein